MSIKDDVKYVEKSLGNDEKLLESTFKLEALYKKHKFKIWAVIAAVVLYFAGQAVMTAMHEAKLVKANEAFLTLQSKSDDATAMKILKDNNPALFELYSFAQAAKKQDVKALESLTQSTNSVLADSSKYTAGVINRKPVDSKLYKEMALLQEAYLAIEAGDVTKAKDKLELIDERSPLGVIASFLRHSTIKAK
ncbi:MAG: hypothetical protein COB07_00130 [Sulfurovum sp.]|nr:MAG: hypothetical protein COB07_00130 [Sulfurovum sp.]